MTEAVRAVTAPFAFETLRLHRVEAAVQPVNEPSLRVLERVGLRDARARAPPLSQDQRRLAGSLSLRRCVAEDWQNAEARRA